MSTKYMRRHAVAVALVAATSGGVAITVGNRRRGDLPARPVHGW